MQIFHILRSENTISESAFLWVKSVNVLVINIYVHDMKQVTIGFICLNKLRLLLFIKNKHVYIFSLLKYSYKYFM